MKGKRRTFSWGERIFLVIMASGATLFFWAGESGNINVEAFLTVSGLLVLMVAFLRSLNQTWRHVAEIMGVMAAVCAAILGLTFGVIFASPYVVQAANFIQNSSTWTLVVVGLVALVAARLLVTLGRALSESPSYR